MSRFADTGKSTPANIEIEGVVAGAEPAEVYRCFIEPGLIAAWWSEEAEAVPEVGGPIVARWVSQGWTMRGRYTEVDPPHRVGFTWSWDHEPEVAERTVTIDLIDDDGGTRLTLRHGPFAPAETEDRSGHVEGWLHFLPKLAALLDAGKD